MAGGPSGPVVPLEQVGTPVPLWKSGFLTPLKVTPLDDGLNWRVDEGFLYESAVLQRIIEIPTGFVTDFASTPSFLWWVLPPTGPWGKPAVVHDELFRTWHLATFEQSNRTFLEAMTHLSKFIPHWKRVVLYEGVQVFGRSSYKGGL